MKKWMVAMGLMAVLAMPVQAWRPAGWVYHDHPWAYEPASGDWMWFNPDTQWVVNMGSGAWARLPDSALASGWAFYNWAFAYVQGNGAWHWINEPDVQWVVNMRTGGWTLFGAPGEPTGMALIQGGTASGTDPDFGAYSLTTEAFYMDRTEVTKALWDEVRDWSSTRGYGYDNMGGGKGTNHPVHTVNWYDCVKWCNARSEKDGREPVYYTDAGHMQVYRTGQVNDIHAFTIANGYRLPTSTQWEYAARGGVANRRFPWGDSDEIQHARANYQSRDTEVYDTSPTRGYHPDYNTDPEPYTSPVGSFAANGYGLYDMAGNLWEWCADEDAGNRIYRGGSCANHALDARNGAWYTMVPTYASRWFGFRTVIRGE